MKSNARIVSVIVLCCVLTAVAVACAGCTETVVVPAEENLTVLESTQSPVTEPEETLPAEDETSCAVILDGVEGPSVTQGGYIRVTVTAPYGVHHVSVSPSGTIPAGQPGVDTETPPYSGNYAAVHVGPSGELSFAIRSVSSDDITVRLLD